MAAKAGFRFADVGYVADISDGEIHVARGNLEGCDFVISASPEELAAVLYGGAPLAMLAITGDIGLARRFVTLFPLPPKVEPAA